MRVHVGLFSALECLCVCVCFRARICVCMRVCKGWVRNVCICVVCVCLFLILALLDFLVFCTPVNFET